METDPDRLQPWSNNPAHRPVFVKRKRDID
jgi:hypothetical protein